MIKNLNGNHEIIGFHGDFNIRIYKNKEYEDYPQHWHSEIEIIMPLENTYQVVVNKETYSLEANEIIIIPPGELHELYAPPSGSRIILQFDSTTFDNINRFNSRLPVYQPCLTISPTSTPELHKELSTIIQNITSEYFSTRPFKDNSAYSMITSFFTILNRYFINTNDAFLHMKKQKQTEYMELLTKVCDYISNHCTENIKMDDIANIAGFSKFHFARLFKQIMKMSWHDYLINQRIMYAEKLLIEPNLSIMQVAMKSGFSSLATFNRVFKERKLCTPTEYKSLHKILNT